jgi:hypothetical protein
MELPQLGGAGSSGAALAVVAATPIRAAAIADKMAERRNQLDMVYLSVSLWL